MKEALCAEYISTHKVDPSTKVDAKSLGEWTKFQIKPQCLCT
jgi:hypothetical protein